MTRTYPPRGDAIQQSEGGKWHRVWWSPRLETPGNSFVTHVGIYVPERHPRRPVSRIAPGDLCRVCFPRPIPPTEDRP